jgi:ribonucleoside-triphosphate reductase (formate)
MLKIKNEIYSRVSGYYRPIEQWNKAKQEEFSERQKYFIPEQVKDEARAKSQNNKS